MFDVADQAKHPTVYEQKPHLLCDMQQSTHDQLKLLAYKSSGAMHRHSK